MSRLSWEEARNYESGVDRGVYYASDGSAEVWNGLVSVAENTEDISVRVRWLDGRKIVNLRRENSFSAVISALSVPSLFLRAMKSEFGFSYRVMTATGYKIHLVYNALSALGERQFNQQESLNPVNVNIYTRVVPIPEAIPSAHLIIDSETTHLDALTAIEDILYGTEGENPRLPLPDEIFDLFEENAIYKVIDNGDGTFTLEAPDDAIEMLDATTFVAEWPRITYLDADSYVIRSW